MPNFRVPIVQTQVVSPIVLTSSTFEDIRPSEHRNCISYEIKVNSNNLDRVITRLNKKKTDSYFIMTGAICALFFSNLVLGHESANLVSKTFNVILSIGSVLTSLGGAYLLHKQKTTIEKIKLLFGSRKDQQTELIRIAKNLPSFAVKKTIQTPHLSES